MHIATVKVKCEVTEDNPAGFYVINESDFNPDTHELFVEEAAKPVADAGTPKTAAKAASTKATGA